MTPRGYEEIKALAKREGVNVTDLLALTPGNDPYYCGMPYQVRNAEWFKENWERLNGSGGHIRRGHYRQLDQGVVPPHCDELYVNDDRCWGVLLKASKFARHLELVDPEDLVDRRNEPVRLYGEPVSHATPIPSSEWFPSGWDVRGSSRSCVGHLRSGIQTSPATTTTEIATSRSRSTCGSRSPVSTMSSTRSADA